MIWNEHSRLRDKHSLLSPSQSSWLNYDTPEKLYSRCNSQYAQKVGTLTHSFAEDHIRYNVKLSRATKNELLLHLLKNGVPRKAIDLEYIYPNLQSYVNDAIKFGMDPEVILFYSDYCFGTADAIIFENDLLRIHDLKTGKTQPHMEQLLIYAALFCLEYKVNPKNINFELRLYQGNEITGFNPTAEDVNPIMDKIIFSDQLIIDWKGDK